MQTTNQQLIHEDISLIFPVDEWHKLYSLVRLGGFEDSSEYVQQILNNIIKHKE